MRHTYTRDDVSSHSDGIRHPLPAVNVKIYTSIEDAWAAFAREEQPDDGFTLGWIRDNISEDALNQLFWDTCAWELEYLESWATSTDPDDSLFPDHHVTLEQQGRSGGWIAVAGLPDLEEWDAILLARWRKFERIARTIADGVPESMLNTIYINEWEWAQTEAQESARAANQDIATLERTP